MTTALTESSSDAGGGLNGQAAHSAGLGELLRGARQRRGLTLQQISQETKIPRRHLEALEHDNLATLPGAFYQRAEVRAYAQVVHLDQHLALAQLETALESSSVHSNAEPSKRGRLAFSRALALILVGVVLAAVVLARVGGGRASSAGHVENIAMPSAATTIDQAAPRTAEPEVPGLPPDTAGLPTALLDAPAASSDGDPTNADTELVVLTEPPGASVTVNGVGWGTAPVTIRYLPPGEKRVRVSRDGYVAEERVLSLASGRRATVDIQLSTQQ
jgi:cytoskeletal protein RodZ